MSDHDLFQQWETELRQQRQQSEPSEPVSWWLLGFVAGVILGSCCITALAVYWAWRGLEAFSHWAGTR